MLRYSERLLHIVDALEDFQRKTFVVREYNVGVEMGRNEPCFCGSGKKRKKCHPEIYEESIIANLLQVYHALDVEAQSNEYTICQKGCADCCSDYFNISIVEFFGILQALKISGDGLALKYSAEARSKIKDVIFPENSDDSQNIANFPACIFVDEITSLCKIYEVRPSLCRMYGNIKNITRCNKILDNEKAMNSLFELSKDIDVLNNIDFIEYNRQIIKMQGKPLIYWFSSLDEDGNLKAGRMRDLFIASANYSINEFLRIILL